MEPSKNYPIPHLGMDLCDPLSVLRKHFGEESVLINLKIDPLLPNDNCNIGNVIKLDLIIRKDQSAPDEHLHLMAKMVKDLKVLEEFSNMTLIYQKEIYAYEELIPMYQKLQRAAGLQESDLLKFAPKIFGSRLSLNAESSKIDDNAIIILENLAPQGYGTIHFRSGLTSIHARLVVKKIATFHALGIVCKHRKPNFFESTRDFIRNPINKNLDRDFYQSYPNPEQDLLTIPELKPYEDRIKKALSLGRWWGIKHFAGDGPWSTVIHGDLWIENILFHHDLNNEPDDTILIDFQLITYDSCCKDLLYLLMCNTAVGVLADHFEDLLDYYYESFINTLKTMDINTDEYDRLSFDQEVDSIGKHMLFQIAHFFKASLIEQDIDHEAKIEAYRHKVITNIHYAERVYPVIKKFIDKGWL